MSVKNFKLWRIFLRAEFLFSHKQDHTNEKGASSLNVGINLIIDDSIQEVLF